MLGIFQCRKRATRFGKSRTIPFVFAYVRAELFGLFSFLYHISFLSLVLWERVRYGLEYCLKEPLNPKQPTKQHPHNSSREYQVHVRLTVFDIVKQYPVGIWCQNDVDAT